MYTFAELIIINKLLLLFSVMHGMFLIFLAVVPNSFNGAI